jgi:parvulin-like peptidyl-prolyl isomerase
MTLRAKPVVKRPGRSGWNPDERRTFLTNLGFTVTIVVAILILLGYAGYSWYDNHFGAAATVDGTTITRDQLRTRYAIESFRIDYTEARIRTLQAAGHLADATASSSVQYLEQRRQSLTSIALERLIDNTLQAKLAAGEGISVSESDIDAQMKVEATVDEERHVWLIQVTPANNPDTGVPGDAEKAAAKAKADAALASLKAGKTWAEVANSTSDDPSAAQNGDLGWLVKNNGLDAPFMDAVFAAPANQPTNVILGDDGIYRIGEATEIAPATVDQTFQTQLDSAGIKVSDYRTAVKGDLIRQDLDNKLVADLSQPSLQRHVLQIYMALDSSVPDGVKVRHILISPNHDPTAAQTLPASDPAWDAAKQEATQIYDEVVADPTKFDELARTKSDETSAKTTGGKLPYYDASSSIDPAFAAAILAPGLQPGQILPPVKSSFGYHIIQFMRPYGTGEEAWLKTIRDQILGGADFAQMATDQGEGPEAAKGGDIGWVAKGQLGSAKEDPIFSAQVGGITDVVSIAGDGVYLWKVLAEQMMTPTKDQIATFKANAFNDWYTAKKAAASITRLADTTKAP